MKLKNHFFIFVFMSTIILSCHSSKKELRGEQTGTANSIVLPTTQEKTATQDTLHSTISQNLTSTVNDTITGVLCVTGNEPFTKLGLQTLDGKMYTLKCTKETELDLRTKQGEMVNVHYDGREKIPEGQALKVVKIEYLHQHIVK